MIPSICKKSTQALNYFAQKKGGKINKMKAIKLIFLADRYHLRKYGRPITGDTYFAMKHGPVGSYVLNAANFDANNLNRDCLDYVKDFLEYSKHIKNLDITSKKNVDLSVFSQTDKEVLETIFKEFSDKDQFELADIITHQFPEWLKHKRDLDSGKKRRVPMNYLDFFENPQNPTTNIFNMKSEDLKLVKDIFVENQEAESILH